MRYIESSSIGALSSILGGRPRAAGAGMFSLIFGLGGKKRLTRAQRRKLARRKYRTFVDNIIMHHKRLHDKNREITINLAKSPNSKQKSKSPSTLSLDENKWRSKFQSKKDDLYTRRVRALSRWQDHLERNRADTDS